ncbi:MAG TPA: Ig-like domain-containing protein [Gemmatimonadales bacterium]|nr:Ig-like domain-containing protein [Gemmatimonadales bacterium]
MTKGSLRLILPVFAALGVACGGDGGLEPGPRRFISLVVTPRTAVLSAVAPGNTLQLTIRAFDQAGATLPSTGPVTYTSSAPATAGVTSSGVVTAGAQGTAEITVALTLDGVTRTASMTVRVYAGDYSDIAGVYDLTALIKTFDAAWEDLTGYRYTAVLTLQGRRGPPWFGGTYADLLLIGPGGDTTDVADSGLVTGAIDSGGRVLIDLLGDGNHITMVLGVDSLALESIDGTFGCCGESGTGGTFTAIRRP